ncbi:MAG: DUF4384 domain-containing protein [bacterium]
MRTKAIVLGILLAGLSCLGTVPALGQEQDEDVRGAFLTTRPKAVDRKGSETVKPNRRRPRTVQNKTSGSVSATATVTVKTTPVTDSKAGSQKLGLGLTLFTRNSLGLAVRVDPTHVFHKGDRVRVLLETNTDGYLYIFNTTDGGPPMMIYPNKDIDDGGNYLQSHVPIEIPSSGASEERLRWLAFDERAGVERLFFVFTREPLANVPIEDELVAYCKGKEGGCNWDPSTDLWTQIQKEMAAPVQTSIVQRTGKSQTSNEQQSATRGIGLSKEDPPPALVTLTTSTSRNLLVATMDLIHQPAGSATNP